MTTIGNLQDYDVLELLRLLQRSQRTGLLTVSRPKDDFRAWFDKGEVVELRLGPVSGELALSLLLNEPVGQFKFEDGLLPPAALEHPTEHLEAVIFRAMRHLPAQSLPLTGSVRLTRTEELRRLNLNPDEQQLLQKLQEQQSLDGLVKDGDALSLLWRLYRLDFLRERRVRVARLNVTLNREKVRVALLDKIILNRWQDDFGDVIQNVLVRDEANRVHSLPVEGRHELGAQLLLPAPLLLKTGLQVGQSVLAKPSSS